MGNSNRCFFQSVSKPPSSTLLSSSSLFLVSLSPNSSDTTTRECCCCTFSPLLPFCSPVGGSTTFDEATTLPLTKVVSTIDSARGEELNEASRSWGETQDKALQVSPACFESCEIFHFTDPDSPGPGRRWMLRRI